MPLKLSGGFIMSIERNPDLSITRSQKTNHHIRVLSLRQLLIFEWGKIHMIRNITYKSIDYIAQLFLAGAERAASLNMEIPCGAMPPLISEMLLRDNYWKYLRVGCKVITNQLPILIGSGATQQISLSSSQWEKVVLYPLKLQNKPFSIHTIDQSSYYESY